ncbi:hypothetical protein H4R19_004166 [Coemansia spiralis]|nr:hypothetical protein H4R19_004166 [Coemansia spiralis]
MGAGSTDPPGAPRGGSTLGAVDGDPQGRGELRAQGGAGVGAPNAAAPTPRSDGGRPAQEGSEGPGAGQTTGAPSEGAAGATSEAAPMDLGSAEERALEKEEAAARQEAAKRAILKNVERRAKAFIEAALIEEAGSAMLPEFEGLITVQQRSAEQRADDEEEEVFQDARAALAEDKKEEAETREHIGKLKKELSAEEEILQRQVKRRTDQESKVVALANSILKKKGSRQHEAARMVLMEDKVRRTDAKLAVSEQKRAEAEADKRRVLQQARSAGPKSWAQVAANRGPVQGWRPPAQGLRPQGQGPPAPRQWSPPAQARSGRQRAVTYAPPPAVLEQLNRKHAAPKYTDKEANLWILTLEGVGEAGKSEQEFLKVTKRTLRPETVKKFVRRTANVVQIAVIPAFWGMAVEAAKILGWTTHLDLAPWDPVPGETRPSELQTRKVAWEKGRTLWGRAAKTESLWTRVLADWVMEKSPPDPDPPAMARADGQPILTPHDQEEGEIVEHPEWVDEPQAGPTQQPEQEAQVANSSLPLGRETVQIKRTRIKEGTRPLEMDGTQGDMLEVEEIPDRFYSDNEDGDETRSKRQAKKPAKKAGTMPAPAAPQGAAAGPSSTNPAMGTVPGGPSTSSQ